MSSFKFSTRTCSQSLLSVVLSIITRSESNCGRASSLGYLSTGFGPRAHREPFCYTLRTGCDETVDLSISTNVRDEDSFNCSAESNKLFNVEIAVQDGPWGIVNGSETAPNDKVQNPRRNS